MVPRLLTLPSPFIGVSLFLWFSCWQRSKSFVAFTHSHSFFCSDSGLAVLRLLWNVCTQSPVCSPTLSRSETSVAREKRDPKLMWLLYKQTLGFSNAHSPSSSSTSMFSLCTLFSTTLLLLLLPSSTTGDYLSTFWCLSSPVYLPVLPFPFPVLLQRT